MKRSIFAACVLAALAIVVAPRASVGQGHIVIRAGRLIDGKGGVRDTVIVVVDTRKEQIA